jgi:tetratricopeptide (TPR) repeat protein
MKNTLVFLLLGLAIGALYANTLSAPFTFDDSQILKNDAIQVRDLSWNSLAQISAESPNRRRLLPNISFGLNYYLNGFNVLGFHLVNILLHIAVSFSFFLLARQTLALGHGSQPTAKGGEIALAAALLWAFHPLQTNAVTYIVQRMTSMATLFFLLALLAYVRARITPGNINKVLFAAAALLLGFMALASKENSGMLPLVILGYELFFLVPRQGGRLPWRRIAPVAGILLVLFFLVSWAFLGSSPLSAILGGYQYRDFTLFERLLTESRVVVHYLSLLILPLPARLNLAYDFPLSSSFLAPTSTLAALLFVLALAPLALLLFQRCRLAAFALFWFGANLLIESSIIPLELIFEHRMYLPAMFPLLAGTAWLYRLQTARSRVARVVVVALLGMLAVLTWQRNGVWQNEIRLWADIVAKAPEQPRSYGNLAKAYGKAGNHKKALALLEQALALAPDDSRTMVSMGVALENLGRDNEALEFFNRALAAPPNSRDMIHLNLARLHLKRKSYRQALFHASEAARFAPSDYDTLTLLATAHFKTGNLRQAEQVLQQIIGLFPEKGDPYVQLATIYEHRDRLAEAAALLEKALAAPEVNRAQAYNTLGIVYWRQQQYQRSVAAALEAIALNPQLLDAYLTLGITYEEMGRQDLAFQQFRLGWERGLDMVAVYNDWARNLLGAKQPGRALPYLLEAIKLEKGRAESHENLGAAYETLGMLPEAAEQRAISRRLRQR